MERQTMATRADKRVTALADQGLIVTGNNGAGSRTEGEEFTKHVPWNGGVCIGIMASVGCSQTVPELAVTVTNTPVGRGGGERGGDLQ